MKKISVIFLIFFVLIAGGCLGKAESQPTFTDTGVTPEENIGRFTIEITADKFNPEELNIKLGDTVTWVNNDSSLHKIKVTEEGSIPLNPGKSWTYKFEKPGEFNFFLSDKAEITGKIRVE